MVSWWTSWEKGLRSVQSQLPERKQLRKQFYSSDCYFTLGCRLGTAPNLAPKNLGHVHHESLSSNGSGSENKLLRGWSATRKLSVHRPSDHIVVAVMNDHR